MVNNVFEQERKNKHKTFLILFVFAFVLFFATSAIFDLLNLNNQQYEIGYIIVAIIMTIYLIFTCATPLAASLAPLSIGAIRIDDQNSQFINELQEKNNSNKSYKMIINIIQELAIAANVQCPSIYIADTQCENAFASGTNKDKASITITQGIINALTRQELEAVLAHEMSHVRNLDIRIQTIGNAFFNAIMFCSYLLNYIASILSNLVMFALMSRDEDNNDDNFVGIAGNFAVVIVSAILLPFAALFLKLCLSRNREYNADAGAVELTHDPQALISALLKIDKDTLDQAQSENKIDKASVGMIGINSKLDKTKWYHELLDTHPATNNRINRLKEMSLD